MASLAAKAKAAASIVVPNFSSRQVGVVVSAGKMDRAVKVRIAGQEWNKRFKKHFPSHSTYLVRDPNNSLVEGDVVRIASGHRTSTAIRHVVTSIIAPFGEPVENRPPVLSEEQLEEERVKDRLLKDVRSARRGRDVSVQRLAQAKRLGFIVPTLEEAMQRQKAFEASEKARIEAQGGQKGLAKAAHEKRLAQGKKTRREVKAEQKLKDARKQTV
ncbi:nucleic acid-binding protein [Plenodomus tracheiphilus IPT5]|uniref:Nucleic acid-binding protein n=1 Tax=Plenodomus tracheiphilus IPT5 TaxID=1408161 RepID=A0A6A7ASU9_9PLEO|nr:nucleic acid-binding protein [Plenodomus tracheiphilus IPT5]